MTRKRKDYGVAEARLLAGVDPATFHMWCVRGLAPCKLVKQGRRTYRRFGLDDVFLTAIMGAVNRLRVPISVSQLTAQAILKNVKDNHGGQFVDHEFARYLMVTWVDDTTIRTDWIFRTDDLPGQLGGLGHSACIFIDVGAIESTLRRILGIVHQGGAGATREVRANR